MAEIGQIYLLPPPVRPPATDRALATQQQAQAPQDGSSQAGSSDQLRARRFRFRVYEGGETSETGTELDTRRTGSNAAATASNIDLGNSDSLQSQNGRSGRSSAQEQLGEGLHNPPFAAATTAYSRTGAALTQRPSAGVDISA